MLKELEIRDFALIENLRVPFTAGFNILTGETGAGKSIIIDALNAVLGGKVGPAIIRPGAERASAEATFFISPEIAAWLKQNELLDESLGQEMIICREITKSGSRARINGTLVNVSALQELRQKLLTIHTQHEARTLQSPQAQLEMLDALGDDEHKKVLTSVRSLYARRREISQQIAEINISEDERSRRLDFARFQLNELVDGHLDDSSEDEHIANQVRALSNVVELESALTNVQELLADGDGEGGSSAIDLIQRAAAELSKAAQLDNDLESISEALNACADTLEQEQRALRKYRDRLDTDPETLSSLETRLAQLATIKRKYGPTLAEAIERRDLLAEEIGKLENSQLTADELRSEYEKLDSALRESALKLSKKRKTLAQNLAARIKAELSDLGMPHCKFEISLDRPTAVDRSSAESSDTASDSRSEIGPEGLDRAEFLIAPNPGQPLMPAAKIASGGELSRVMLAVKSIFAHADRVATVIFDEIEAGLSGKVLQAMRDKLAKLAISHQILCITHQPIIASVADNHIEVSKHQTATNTKVTAAVLDEQQRLSAVAGMASGQEGQTEALKFAQSLFADSNKLRNSLKV
jgi:DNA repair protein RecN (Recombination protein N)